MNKKCYSIAMVLYADTTDYNIKEVLTYIENNYQDYAYILHDKDLKKLHYHVVLHFPNKRYISSISKELGVPANYIQKCNLIPYLRYLIHIDDEDKKQYSIDEVHGTLKAKLVSLLEPKLDEIEQVSIISSFIFESTDYLSHTIILQYVLKVHCYSAYRRNFTLFDKLMLEHNKNI